MSSDSGEDDTFDESHNVGVGTDDEFDRDQRVGLFAKRESNDGSLNERPSSSPVFGNNDSNYTQLKNFAGLTSPITSEGLRERISQKDSVVSSLSSLSHDDVESHQAPRSERRASQDTHNSDFSDVSKGNSEEVDSTSLNQISDAGAIRRLNRLFSVTGSDGLPNPYFQRESVRVTTDKPTALFKDKLRLVQKLNQHNGAIWTMKISPLGGFLATAGQDTKVIVWRLASLSAETAVTPSQVECVFASTPFRVYEGHTGDVIDLAWSKSNFILSASTDKTVRLWHVTRNDCLQFFRHTDIVTSVEFHPAHDRFFISGCFDRRLRLWDIIPDGNVREWAQAPDTITAVSFSPDGQTIAVGLIRGQVYFYEYEGMKYKTQMNCKNRSGKYKHGTKVTGMVFQSVKKGITSDLLSVATPGEAMGATATASAGRQRKSLSACSQLLVTTNDSRVRLCHLEDYSMLCKYKGLKNKAMQIRASFCEDGRLVVCGSETGAVFIWNTLQPPEPLSFKSLFGGNKQNRNVSFESFECTPNSDAATTVAVFAPSATVFTWCRELNKPTTTTATSSPATTSAAAARDVVNFSDKEAVLSDFCCRLVVTADYNGSIKVFIRLT